MARQRLKDHNLSGSPTLDKTLSMRFVKALLSVKAESVRQRHPCVTRPGLVYALTRGSMASAIRTAPKIAIAT